MNSITDYLAERLPTAQVVSSMQGADKVVHVWNTENAYDILKHADGSLSVIDGDGDAAKDLFETDVDAADFIIRMLAA